jgi:PhzF family phenazine biosynthesis protein
MKLAMYQVDAFTDRRFGGNPAAVVLLKAELPDATLQAIAAENNLSETAFVLPAKDHYRLRWFTPRVEVDLCGHATLGTAHVLFQTGAARGDSVRFETAGGTLRVSRDGELLCMDFPARPARPVECPSGLAAALGAEPAELLQARDLMAVFEDEDQIAAMNPDPAAVAAQEAFAVIATAPGREVDFVSRFFAPKVGIPEDPVTGSAHCTLVPYWAERLGKKELHARQLSPRGGELFCEHRGERVILRGRVVEYLRGQIEVD